MRRRPAGSLIGLAAVLVTGLVLLMVLKPQ